MKHTLTTFWTSWLTRAPIVPGPTDRLACHLRNPLHRSVVKSGPARMNADVHSTATIAESEGFSLRWVTDDPRPRTVILFGARGVTTVLRVPGGELAECAP